MSNAENCAIRFGLRTPLCIHTDTPVQRMPFEARLTRLLIDRLGDADSGIKVMRELVDHWSVGGAKIAKASQCILEGPALSVGSIPFTRDILRTVTDSEARGRITDTKWDNNIDTLRRPFKFPVNSYEMIQVKSIWYFIRGNPSEIQKVLASGSKKIGPLRAKGGADIEAIDIEVVPNRSAMFGIVCAGKLMRPVPARFETELTAKREVAYLNGMIESWHIPYHDPDYKELCLVPVQANRHMVMTLDRIGELAA